MVPTVGSWKGDALPCATLDAQAKLAPDEYLTLEERADKCAQHLRRRMELYAEECRALGIDAGTAFFSRYPRVTWSSS